VDKKEAIESLKTLVNQNLHELAKRYDVPVLTPLGTINKGWAGHVFERFLGLPLNSAQSPNFGSWELKSIPLKRCASGTLTFKETMAVTMLDPYHVAHTPFAESHLLQKLRKAVIVARIVGKTFADPTFVHSVTEIELTGDLYSAVEADYELARACLNDPRLGFSCLTGKMGKYVQPRTKGKGHGSTTRAFYARPIFLRQFIIL
jgi:hypothetical protein